MRRYSAWIVVLLLVALVAVAIRHPVVERHDRTKSVALSGGMSPPTPRALMPDTQTGPRRLMQILNDDMAPDAETAIALAETLIRRRYGEDSLSAQQPLSARDAGKYWAIDGTPDAVEPDSGFGPVRIEVRKVDAGFAALYFDPPSAVRAQMEDVQEKLRRGEAP